MRNSRTYRGLNFPAEFISHIAWLYCRFSLSFRDIEEVMAAQPLRQQALALTPEDIVDLAVCRKKALRMAG